MSTKRIIALVVGCVMLIPALGMFIGGAALTIAYATQRDEAGYFDVTIESLQSSTVAITGEDVRFSADPGSPDWVIDAIDLDVRLIATSLDPERAIFIGIARQADLDAYLDGVAHDVVRRLDDDGPAYRRTNGTDDVAPPRDETFWVASSTGTGQQELTWEATSGRWAAVLMNADGSPGVAATLNVGARSDLVLPVAIVLTGIGLMLLVPAVILIVVGASGARRRAPAVAGAPAAEPGSPLPPPVSSGNEPSGSPQA
jgi:hypothetical protein